MIASPPVLFLIFNRPDTTRKAFEAIRRQQPRRLFVAADGPRADRPDDIALCHAARQIISEVDWKCEVKTLFSERNLGCGLAPATGMNWFFNQVNEGIILEDDCVPNDSFFSYCATLLEKYRHSDQVMMICGTSYQPKPLNKDSYYFSNYPHVWGWATWKRAWDGYNFSLEQESDSDRKTVIRHTFSNIREQQFWEKNMNMIIQGLDAWDYQWMYWIWKKRGLCVTPWQNMVSNVGFGSHGTHTLDSKSGQAEMERHILSEIKHPGKILRNVRADTYERNHILTGSDLNFYYRKVRFIVGKFIKPLLLKK